MWSVVLNVLFTFLLILGPVLYWLHHKRKSVEKKQEDKKPESTTDATSPAFSKEAQDWLWQMKSAAGHPRTTITYPPSHKSSYYSQGVHYTPSPAVAVNAPSASFRVRTITTKHNINTTKYQYSDEPSEHHIGYVYGLRRFRTIGCNGDYLHGLYAGRWYSPRMNAKCVLGDSFRAKPTREGVPHASPCKCGINFYTLNALDELEYMRAELEAQEHTYIASSFYTSTPRNVWASLTQRDLVTTNGGIATGTAITKGWGKVIKHDDGYRVQKALVTDIYQSPRNSYSYYPDFSLPTGWKKRGVVLHRDEDSFLAKVEEYKSAQKLVQIPASES